jgi:hypothetical protein
MATIIAALVAAVVATFGYTITARAKLLEDRRKTYAAALSAVCDYQELPYRIRRRPHSSAATSAALGTIISDIQRDLDFHSQLLELDSPKLGRAYRSLVEKSRRLGKPHRDEAWAQAPADEDKAMSFPEEYRYEGDNEWVLCMERMREQLRLVPLRGISISGPDRRCSSAHQDEQLGITGLSSAENLRSSA